jgi:uncharacterized protein
VQKYKSEKNLEFNINTKGKGLFLGLSSIGLLLMMIVTTLLWWFISPRLHEINTILAELSLNALRIFYILLIFGTTLVFLTSYLEKNFLIARFAIRMFIKILFPVTMLLGRILRIPKDTIRESYVHVNNSFINAMKNVKLLPKNILILLPHCLQNTDCAYRISVNISNCIKCNKCDIANLCRLSDKYEIPIAVATGGTLARRIIVKNKPKFIIAVACQRDLVSGLQEVFPIPVYGVLNDRPEGPCVNTRVATEKIEYALKNILK